MALLAAGALLAGGWLLGGPLSGRWPRRRAGGAARRRPRAAASATARRSAGARRARPARSPTRSAAGHSIRGALGRDRAGVRGAAGARAAGRGARARPRGADGGGARALRRPRGGCRAWDTLIAAILLQRDAGGDLPALLRDLAAALEAARRLERDARTATAQARFTAWLVVGLPLAAAALAELAAPGFLAGLIAAPLPAALTALRAVAPGDRPRRDPSDRAGEAPVTAAPRRRGGA